MSLAIAVSIYVLFDVKYDEPRLTCMGVPFTAGSKAWLLYYTIIVLDLITAGLFMCSLKLNKDHGKGHKLVWETTPNIISLQRLRTWYQVPTIRKCQCDKNATA